MSHRPTRLIAILLAALVGCGVGHFYLGLQRRAFVWLGAMALAIFLFAGLMLPLGHAIGIMPALCLWGVVFLIAWLGPIIDLVRIPEKSYVPTPAWKVLAFACGFAVVSIATPLMIRVFLMEAYKIPAGSMLPTLAVGDHIFADKLRYRISAPTHGDVAVFQFPEHPEQDFVKRVIAIPGDVLTVQDGHPRINGWEVPHCIAGRLTVTGSDGNPNSGMLEVEYLYGKHYFVLFDERQKNETHGPFVASPGEYWVLGDNRNNSHDSRYWAEGRGRGVPRNLFRGRAAFVWMASVGGRTDMRRTGMAVDRPLLTDIPKELGEGVERCLKAAPPPEQTIPPKPH